MDDQPVTGPARVDGHYDPDLVDNPDEPATLLADTAPSWSATHPGTGPGPRRRGHADRSGPALESSKPVVLASARAAAGTGLGGRTELRPLLESSDVVSLRVPLIESTRDLIDTDPVAALPDQAILDITCRGRIVDEEAVVAVLPAGKVRSATDDVFESQPVGAESGHRLAGVPNLIVAPHVAGLIVQSQRRIGEVMAANVRALAGAP